MKKLLLSAAAAVLALALPSAAGAQAPVSTVWMTSTLGAYGDGLHATATCTTTAVDPATGVISLTGLTSQHDYYLGFSTACNVIRVSDQKLVSSSLTTPSTKLCPQASNPLYASLGTNIAANPTSTCIWNFTVTPGETYILTSKHYLWLNTTTSADYPPNGTCAVPSPAFEDPLAWWDIPNENFPLLPSPPTPIYPTHPAVWDTTTAAWTTPGLTYTDAEDAETIANNSGDEGCKPPQQTDLAQQDNTKLPPVYPGVWLLVDTQAQFTAASILDTETPSYLKAALPAAELFQTQNTSFNSDLPTLGQIHGMGSDNLNWCIQPAWSGCAPGLGAGTQGTLGTSTASTGVQSAANAGNTVGFYAPAAISGGALGEWMCVEESLQTKNFTCGGLVLYQLAATVSPAGGMGPFGNGPISLGPNGSQQFTASLGVPALADASAVPALAPPAGDLAFYPQGQGPVGWNWSLAWGTPAGPNSACQPGPVNSWGPATSVPDSSGYAASVYSYCAPASLSGTSSSGTLTATANVTLPSFQNGSIELTSNQAEFEVNANAVNQTVTFPQFSAQTAATSIPLTATASSGLAVSFLSTTPGVCTVSGATASLVAGGVCSLTAEQNGNSTYQAASATQSFTVNLASQVVTFPVISGQSVNSVAALAASSSSGLPVSYATTTPNICTVSGSTAALVTGGTCTITAAQPGNVTYLAAAPVSASFIVSKLSTFASVTSSNSQVQVGQSVSFLAYVNTVGGNPVPTGTLSFYSGSTLVGQQTLVGGQATLTLSSLPTGADTITADYLGDANYAAVNSPGITETVNKLETTVSLVPSGSPVAYGTPLTLTATVASQPPLGTPPTGTVLFYVDGAHAGLVTLSNGVATLPVGTLLPGSHAFGAQYGGDANYYEMAPGSVWDTVNKVATTVTLTPSANPVAVGATLTMTATVAGGISGVAPTGTATFYVDSANVGPATVVNGSASYQTNSLTAGSHRFGVEYGGDSNYVGVGSAAVWVTAQ